MNNHTKNNFQVMIADDSADDRWLIRSALRRTSRLQVLNEVADGAEAISYLRGLDAARLDGRGVFPDLLLLDLKMPHKDGFDVLRWLRTQEMEGLMVVALTDSMNPAHIRRALDLGADLFQVKPNQAHERVAMVLALEQHLVGSYSAAARRVAIPTAHLHAARQAFSASLIAR